MALISAQWPVSMPPPSALRALKVQKRIWTLTLSIWDRRICDKNRGTNQSQNPSSELTKKTTPQPSPPEATPQWQQPYIKSSPIAGWHWRRSCWPASSPPQVCQTWPPSAVRSEYNQAHTSKYIHRYMHAYKMSITLSSNSMTGQFFVKSFNLYWFYFYF